MAIWGRSLEKGEWDATQNFKSLLYKNLYKRNNQVPRLPNDLKVPAATAGEWRRVSYICGKQPESRVIEWGEVALGFETAPETEPIWKKFYQNAAWTFSKPLGSFALYVIRDDYQFSEKGSPAGLLNLNVARKIMENDRKMLSALQQSKNYHIIMIIEKEAPFFSLLNSAHSDFMKYECLQRQSRRDPKAVLPETDEKEKYDEERRKRFQKLQIGAEKERAEKEQAEKEAAKKSTTNWLQSFMNTVRGI